MEFKYDCSGWATKNDLLCSDGRTIRKDAFKDQDGTTVPVVWMHNHSDPTNVLGNALLHNMPEGVYAYLSFNDTPKGYDAKQIVKHGDINSLSIWANQLNQRGGDVLHGTIKEVSLVLAGANPGACIDTIMMHGEECEDQAIIYTGEEINLEHGNFKEKELIKKESIEDNNETSNKPAEEILNTLDEKQKNIFNGILGKLFFEKSPSSEYLNNRVNDSTESNETVEDFINTLNEEQKNAVYTIIGSFKRKIDEENNKEGDSEMKHNLFENTTDTEIKNEKVLSHDDMRQIITDMKRYGSLKESCIQHGIEEINCLSHADGDYGITNIDYLFPEAKNVNNVPDFIKRDDDWVAKVMNSVHHVPFSRIKSIHANITADEARAKGYVKGNLKLEEVITLLKRTTTPCTVYKKQKLDRDDIIDITDFDVVAWLKGEMRMMVKEELARAYLVGDGRSPASDDKIDETHIRPIWTDSSIYTINVTVPVAVSDTDDDKAKNFIKTVIKNRKLYKGSGNPSLYCTEDLLCDMLLITDLNGHDMYSDVSQLCKKLRVKEIIPVPVMESKTRSVNGVSHTLAGILVNLNDYSVGADKGGAINMFDDFDIDYNQEKYLMETRCSGALTKPFSAMAIEYIPAT